MSIECYRGLSNDFWGRSTVLGCFVCRFAFGICPLLCIFQGSLWSIPNVQRHLLWSRLLPSNFLIYLGKRFGYVVSGIDTVPYITSRLPSHIVRNGVKIGEFYHQDLLTFESNQTYDVVCSFGFIEHFSNFEDVIEKHIRLVKPRGTLILSCPNFRGLQYILHRLLDPTNLHRHVLSAMNLRRWRMLLERNSMVLQYHGYYRKAGFWWDTPTSSFSVMPARSLVGIVTGKIPHRT